MFPIDERAHGTKDFHAKEPLAVCKLKMIRKANNQRIMFSPRIAVSIFSLHRIVASDRTEQQRQGATSPITHFFVQTFQSQSRNSHSDGMSVFSLQNRYFQFTRRVTVSVCDG